MQEEIKIFVNYEEDTRKILKICSTDIWEEKNIPNPKIEIDEDKRQIICSKGHNYISEKGVTEHRDMRTVEEIAEQERIAKLPSQEEVLNDKITLRALELITELGLI